MILMIVGALIAVETPSMLLAIISVGAVGFLLSIAFLLLGAPDIALTQIVVEIIALVLLIRATIRKDADIPAREGALFTRMAAVAAVVLLTVFSFHFLADFPEFGHPVIDRQPDAPANAYLAQGLEQTGAANIVTSVLLDFRAYDTLGEATVLFGAVLGALVVLRRKARKAEHEPDEEDAT
jgi:multisubunit Na+/H+ antiporter MnhB subunit